MKKSKASNFFNTLFWKIKTTFQRIPMLGEIDGKSSVLPGKINSKKFGTSFGMPMAVEININNKKSMPEDVGKIVKEKLFSDNDYKDKTAIFNVCFSCGKGSIIQGGTYTDPTSHWFNVFFGYYEIDVPQKAWGRPFGYQQLNGSMEVNFQDLLRIGLADWNYFSNYLYGVPLKKASQYLNTSDPKVTTRYIDRMQIKQKTWDYVEIDNFEVVSAYTARGKEDELEERSIWTGLWRRSYGYPHPRKGFNENFFPCRMKAHFYMAFGEGHDHDLNETAYKTYIFGGTINHNIHLDNKAYAKKCGLKVAQFSKDTYNEEFLQEQMKSIRKVIEKKYYHLGFPD